MVCPHALGSGLRHPVDGANRLPRYRLATERFILNIDVFVRIRGWVSAVQCHDFDFAERGLSSRARNFCHALQHGYRDENETMEIRNRT